MQIFSADGRTDGRTDGGSTRGPRGPKKYTEKSRITSNDSLLGGRLQRQQSINDMAGNPVSSIFYHRMATVVFRFFSIITILSNFGRKQN